MKNQSNNQSESKEQKLKLSKRDRIILEKKRKLFRDLHNSFSETGMYDAEQQLQMALDEMGDVFMHLQDKMRVKELNIKSKDEKSALIFSILKDVTIPEASAFMNALLNAISHTKYAKTKDIKVKELDITLL